ncbi:hypothetical protein GCM10007973_25980 [Polymorphobacter multimanifer]|uniref:Flp pilus assembly protein CpaB n=1 Tax=Polymorphobacter multimanifer TaxID=1070431 RepID=UPI0016671B81|nr:Flp pilus assembly protein CpaB [Polymorphobacter multimanifer]GGI88412.1 hypothetical protein GCM10007973_25980 [Polymorphobacter multimanifer]
MRKSAIYMLVAAIALGLFAVFLARTMLGRSAQVASAPGEVATVQVVVAAAPIGFGEKVTLEKLKLVRFPSASLPAGTYSRVSDVVDEGQRVAVRALDPNELSTERTISGQGGRLSVSPLFGETMRAVSLPVSEVSGAGGFLVPGDRVDVFVTHSGSDDELPRADLLVQGARVLAIGQRADAGDTTPQISKSLTVEVTPVQAQKIALAQNVGTLSVALRNLADESRVQLATTQLFDLTDGMPSRILRKAAQRSAEPAAASASPAPRAGPIIPPGPQVEVFRGGKGGTSTTSYGVPRG